MNYLFQSDQMNYLNYAESSYSGANGVDWQDWDFLKEYYKAKYLIDKNHVLHYILEE